MIFFDAVSKLYPNDHLVLDRVTFSVRAGEMACLIGRSGAGKTTLLKLILHIEQPTAGNISINGQKLSELKKHRIPYYRRQMSVLFQHTAMLPQRSVYEHVALPLEMLGYSPKTAHRLITTAIESVDLSHHSNKLPHQLSISERRRTHLARVLVTRPMLLLIDEPTEHFDEPTGYKILQLLKQVNNMGTTVLLTSRNPSSVQPLGCPMLSLGATAHLQHSETIT